MTYPESNGETRVSRHVVRFTEIECWDCGMTFTVRSADLGGTVTTGTTIRTADAGALLALLGSHPEWRYLVIDGSAVDRRRPMERDDELQAMHELVRTIRAAGLPNGFRVAIVPSPPIAALVADFVDMAHTILDGLDARRFDDVESADVWAAGPTDTI